MIESHLVIDAPRGRLEHLLGQTLILAVFVCTVLSAVLILTGSVPVVPVDVVLLIIVTFLAIRIFSLVARNDADGRLLYQLLVLAWFGKLVAMSFKLNLLFTVVGASDASDYHDAGIEIARQLARGIIPDLGRVLGTDFINLLTGVLYVFTGPALVGGWVVWSFFGSMGMLLHYKAFTLALPGARRKLFMALVLLYPSVLIWTNSVGKDAIIAFPLGMTALGVATWYRRGLTLPALLFVACGMAGCLLVRPQTAAIVAAGLVAAALMRPVRTGALSPIIRVALFAVIAALAAVVISNVGRFVGVEEVSAEGISDFLVTKSTQSAEGTFAFETRIPRTPLAYGSAVLTVLFRPYPWEASGLIGVGLGIEGLTLLTYIMLHLRVLGRALRAAWGNAYLSFAAVYVLLFIFFFSAIANFGILVRQRVQVLPFVFVLLAYQSSPLNKLTDS